MFAYCGNNPITRLDSNGTMPCPGDIFSGAVKWVTENGLKPITKAVKSCLSKIDATYSAGFNLSGSPNFWIFNAQAGLSIDTKGNVEFQYSLGGGVTGGSAGISFTRYASVTNAPTVSKLEGEFAQIGGTVNDVLCVSGDFLIIPDSSNGKVFNGITLNAGVGFPIGGEVHAEWGETWPIGRVKFNVFDVLEQFCDSILGW